MKKSRSIAENTLFDSAAQVGVMAISLVAGIVLARTLGDTGRGAYVLATSFAGMVLLGMTNMGLELAASVLVAKNPRRLPEIHTLIVLACVLIGVIVFGAAWSLQPFFQTILFPGLQASSLYLLAGAIPFWIYLFGIYGILVGLDRIRERAAFDLGFNLTQNILVIAILLFASRGEALRLLIFSYYATITAAAFFVWRLIGGTKLWAVPGWKLVKEFYKYGFWVYIGNMGTNFGQRIDQYFVQQVSTGSAAFGVYTLATSLTQRTRVFPQALSRSAYARICNSPAPEAARLVAATFRQMLLLGIILIVLGAAASPLIPIVYTRDFAPAVVPFIIFLFGRLFHNCSWMLANYFSGHLARPQIPMIVNWTLLPIQGIAAYFAMKTGGLAAVALITSISYVLLFAAFLVLFLAYQKHVGIAELFRIRSDDIRPWLRIFRKRV